MPDNQTIDDMNASEAKVKRDAMVRESGLSGRDWYREVYLMSDHWKDLRLRALHRGGKKQRCNRCGFPDNLDVHHLNYRNIYDVTVDDLEVLCRRCHMIEHGEAPKPAKPPKPKRHKGIGRKERKPRQKRNRHRHKKKRGNKKVFEATPALYSGPLPLTEAEIISLQIIRDMQDQRRSRPEKGAGPLINEPPPKPFQKYKP